MKRMIIFTRTDGKRIGITAFDIHRVYSTEDANMCNIVYTREVGSEWCEEAMDVVGTFDDVMARIEETSK